MKHLQKTAVGDGLFGANTRGLVETFISLRHSCVSAVRVGATDVAAADAANASATQKTAAIALIPLMAGQGSRQPTDG